MKKTFYLIIIICFTLVQCKKENPFVDKELVDNLIKDKNPTIGNVAFIFENDIFYLKEMEGEATRLTSTPNDVKTHVNLSYDRSKIAYLNENQKIVVIDATTGDLMEEVDGSEGTDHLGWSSDGNTIYYLIGRDLHFHGPVINPPDFGTFTFAKDEELRSISLSPNNDWAFIRTIYNPRNLLGGPLHFQELKIIKNTGEELVFRGIPDNISSNQLVSVKFSGNNNDFVVGYSFSGRAKIFSEFELYSDFSGTPDLTLESSEKHSTMIYNSTVNYLISGYEFNEDKGYLKATYLEYYEPIIGGKETLDIERKEFFVPSNQPFYVDWK